MEVRVELAPDHRANNIFAGEILARSRFHNASVAHHRDAVGDSRELFHPMRDIDDADPSASQHRNDGKKPFDLAIGERRRRLVHDDDARGSRQDLSDLDELLLADGELGDGHVERHAQAELVEDAHRALHGRSRIDQPAACWLGSERDVRDCGQLRHERKLLVDHPDAQMLRSLRRIDLHRCTVDRDLPTVGAKGAG